MEKLKNVLNPGHSEVDAILYDTGKNSKKHIPTKTHDQSPTGNGPATNSTASPRNPPDTIPDRTSSKSHVARDSVVGAGAGGASVAGHEQYAEQRQPPVAREHENQTGISRDSDATKSAGPHNSSLLNKLDPRVKSDQHVPGDEAQQRPGGAQEYTPVAAVGAGVTAHEHQGDQHTAVEEHEPFPSKKTEPRKRGLLTKLDPRHKSNKEPTGIEEQKKFPDHALMTTVGAGATGAVIHEDDQHQVGEKHDSTTPKTTEPHKSSILNKLDPRVKSDHPAVIASDQTTTSNDHAALAAVGAGAAATGVAAHEHHKHKEQPVAPREPYENRSSAHEHSSPGNAHHKIHKEPPNNDLRASRAVHESDPMSAVGPNAGVAAHDHDHDHDHQYTTPAEQNLTSNHRHASQVAAGAGLAGAAYAAHEHHQQEKSRSANAPEENTSAAAAKPSLPAHTDTASYNSSAPSYASNASIKSGVQGRAPVVEGGMPLPSVGQSTTSPATAVHEKLPHVPTTDGRFMSEDVAKEAGYPHDEPNSSHVESAALSGAGAATVAYALHRNYKDGESHDAQSAMVPPQGNISGPASKTIGPHKSNLANIVDPRVTPIPALMKGNKNTTAPEGDVSGPASKTIGPHKSNIANIVDPSAKPVPELMKGNQNETTSRRERDDSAPLKSTDSRKGGILGKIVSKVKSNPDSTPDKKHTADSSANPHTKESIVGLGGQQAITEHKTSPTAEDSITDSHSPPTSSKDPVMHKSKILNFLDPRVKSDKGKTRDETESTHNPSSPEFADTSKTHATPDHTTSSTGTAMGDASTSTATSAAKCVEPTPTSEAVDPPNVATSEPTGVSGVQGMPTHTDAANAADGKGGVLTGEKAKHGDPSNPYSAVPLDPRVDMPGTYPESTTDLSK